MISAAYTEALERALARVVSDAERQMQALAARCDATVAAMQARVTEAETRMTATEAVAARRLAAVESGVADRVAARLAEIEPPDVAETVRGLMPAPFDPSLLIERLAAVEARKMPVTDLGPVMERIKDIAATLERLPGPPEPPETPDVGAMVQAAVGAAVAALPEPQPGKDADMNQVRAWLDEAVALAVKAAIPVLPEPPDLSGFALRSELPAIPEARDYMPEIEAVAARIDEAKADLAERIAKAAARPGVFPIAREWTDEVHYAGAVVRHDGALWQAVRDTGRAPGGGDWACLASAGADGRSVDVRGTYAEGEAYRRLDLVALNGGSFIALRDDPGACPGDGWQLIAQRGKPGMAVKGDKGDKGDAAKGDPGPPVVAGEINDDGLVRLTNGDGSVVEIDLYPVLSRIAK